MLHRDAPAIEVSTAVAAGMWRAPFDHSVTEPGVAPPDDRRPVRTRLDGEEDVVEKRRWWSCGAGDGRRRFDVVG